MVLALPGKAIDGDTIQFYFVVPAVGRLVGINAPECKGATAAAGKASRDYLQSLLPATPCAFRLAGREKYGRLLIEVYGADGKSLNAAMIEAGHAQSYDGKGPRT
jgi:endonuclease YncB( thermonuclease family)